MKRKISSLLVHQTPNRLNVLPYDPEVTTEEYKRFNHVLNLPCPCPTFGFKINGALYKVIKALNPSQS